MTARHTSGPSSVHNFSQLSEFLRAAVTDEESAQMGESMGALAAQVETAIAQIQGGLARAAWASLLMDFLTTVREHRAFVVALSPSWRGLYEYPNYLNALNNFRVLIGQWLMELAQPPAQQGSAWPGLADFEPIAWRTLGEGMLLIDMHEHLRGQMPVESEAESGALDATRLERARSWWGRLRK